MMPKLAGFTLQAGKLYAVGVGSKKKPVMTTYNVDMDQWYIRFGDAPWNHLGEFIEQNPGIEIDEVDAEGRQVSDSAPEVAWPAVAIAAEVDVMPTVQSAASALPDQQPAWME
jgi:hypothetical protein